MKRRVRPTIGYIMLIYITFTAVTAVLSYTPPSHTQAPAVQINEPPELAEYRRQLTHTMHLVTESGCFKRTDFCQTAVQRILTYATDGMTVEWYHRRVLKEVDNLWESGCLRKVANCRQEVQDLLNSCLKTGEGG